MIDQAPYRKVEDVTLRQIAADPMFAKGWYAKIVDGNGPFVIPLNMFFSQFKSENTPDLDYNRTAFFNENEHCVLLVPEYSSQRIITLLYWTAALDYSDSEIDK